MLKKLAILFFFVFLVSGAGCARSRFIPGARTTGITPTKEFFIVDIKGAPSINVGTWRLKVDGKVANPMTVDYTYLGTLPQHSQVILLQCVEGPSGRAKWTGPRLRDVLALARPNKSAREVVFHCEDGYSTSIPLTYARRSDVLLALKMNDEILPKDHGFPIRAVVPGKFGYKWAKWITRIEVVNYDYKGYWESRGWDDEARLSP